MLRVPALLIPPLIDLPAAAFGLALATVATLSLLEHRTRRDARLSLDNATRSEAQPAGGL